MKPCPKWATIGMLGTCNLKNRKLRRLTVNSVLCQKDCPAQERLELFPVSKGRNGNVRSEGLNSILLGNLFENLDFSKDEVLYFTK